MQTITKHSETEIKITDTTTVETIVSLADYEKKLADKQAERIATAIQLAEAATTLNEEFTNLQAGMRVAHDIQLAKLDVEIAEAQTELDKIKNVLGVV